MEDIFYFTRSEVSPEHLAELSHTSEYGARLCPWSQEERSSVNVYYGGERFWQFIPLGDDAGDLDTWEPEARRVVAAYQPASAYIVVHHADSWPELRSFLLRVLRRYGGWIGSDTESLAPSYTADDIESAPYPYPLVAIGDELHVGGGK